MRHPSNLVPGYEVVLHRSLTEPILLAGAPRSFAILNGTMAAAIGLGLRLWIAGLLIWLAGHAATVWITRKDPAFLTVLSRHARHKGALSC
ncbi:VirB3 family type IV secretion system protein [Hyphomicrobium zavarzinii]|jgi:type IV secretion system protein VirB3|uniref:VirB3 family type IV secretion system protein n=1 Tax=Hyphomicrobium zavarzinii TaxID=48292 RepID=UPI0003712B4D|nr:VirB3 family type IV secretion system protein [Hyphomicrobium zavarzinii]